MISQQIEQLRADIHQLGVPLPELTFSLQEAPQSSHMSNGVYMVAVDIGVKRVGIEGDTGVRGREFVQLYREADGSDGEIAERHRRIALFATAIYLQSQIPGIAAALVIPGLSEKESQELLHAGWQIPSAIIPHLARVFPGYSRPAGLEE